MTDILNFIGCVGVSGGIAGCVGALAWFWPQPREHDENPRAFALRAYDIAVTTMRMRRRVPDDLMPYVAGRIAVRASAFTLPSEERAMVDMMFDEIERGERYG